MNAHLKARIQTSREIAKKHRAILRRSRALYVRFCRSAIATDRTSQTMCYCARRMIDSGMYARSTCERSVRYHILRGMWKYDRGIFKGDWHQWYSRMGWEPFRFLRTSERVKYPAAA